MTGKAPTSHASHVREVPNVAGRSGWTIEDALPEGTVLGRGRQVLPGKPAWHPGRCFSHIGRGMTRARFAVASPLRTSARARVAAVPVYC